MSAIASLSHGFPARADAAGRRLQFSDHVFLGGLWLAFLIILVDPFVQISELTEVRHLPFLLSVCGVFLVSVGAALSAGRSRAVDWPLLHTGWPLLVLALWIIAGGAYARWHDGLQDSFTLVGIYMLFGLLAARVVAVSPARQALVRVYLIAAAVASAVMVVRMLFEFDVPDRSYHDMEAVVIPLAVYFALRPGGSRRARICLTGFFLLATFSFWKNTAFLILPLVVAYLWVVEWRHLFRERPALRQWVFVALFLAGLVVAAVTILGLIGGERLPTGNTEFRLHTYQVAWERFLDSPAWGSSFTASAAEKFPLYEIALSGGRLPTHNDVLDLAANGGCIALVLWLLFYARAGRLAWRHAFAGPPRDDLSAAAHAFACMSLCSVVVYFFNPVMLYPVKAMVLWTHAGFLLGIALYRQGHGPVHARLRSASPLHSRQWA
jgi:O-antigen ligase